MELDGYFEGQEFESKNFEFKEIVSHKNYEKWAKTISAFANTDGGKIFFGVDDDGNAVGIEKETLKQDIHYINDICDKKIFPRVVYEFTNIKLDESRFVLMAKLRRVRDAPFGLEERMMKKSYTFGGMAKALLLAENKSRILF